MDNILRSQSSSSPIVVGVFDFDGTLTKRDSLLPFLYKSVGSLQLIKGLFVLSPMLINYAIGKTPNWQAKEKLLSYFFRNYREDEFQRIADKFALKYLPKMIRKEALQRLKWHQNQGHKLILLSASLEYYLLPWAEKIGFDHVLATQLEVKSGMLTGHFLGKNCYGVEKVNRLKSVLGDLNKYCIYAYGDSKGDRELLQVAKYSYYQRFE